MALYGGRLEADNGCEEMLDYFDSYAAGDGDTSLVLMGVKMMRVTDEPYLRQAGVLEQRVADWMAGWNVEDRELGECLAHRVGPVLVVPCADEQAVPVE